MSDTLLRLARMERRKLFSELKTLPAFNRWLALRQLMDAYADPASDDDAQNIVTPPQTSITGQSARIARSESRSAQIESATAAWFERTQKRAQSMEIMRELESLGFTFSGPKPTTALASILSHSDLFDNVRGEGYGLRAWSKVPELSPEPLDQPGSDEAQTKPAVSDAETAGLSEGAAG